VTKRKEIDNGNRGVKGGKVIRDEEMEKTFPV
jgi:hypothetical protein